MKEQNYRNHVRYYFPHHFIFYPVISVGFMASIWFAYFDVFNRVLWLMVAILFFFITALSFMLRQHYALNNQNRIIRLELRFRYYVLTQKRLEEKEAQLSRVQLYALRFASDDELPALIDRAIMEKLSPDQIKKSIKTWLPDDMRA